MEWGRPSPESLGLVEWKWAASQVEAVNSGFLSISDFDHRVPAELGQESQCMSFLRNGTPLASRVFQGITGHLSSFIWDLRVFPVNAIRMSVPLRVVTSSTMLHSKRCPGIGFLSRVDTEIGVFWNVA